MNNKISIVLAILVVLLVGFCGYNSADKRELEIIQYSTLTKAEIQSVFKTTGATMLKYCFYLDDKSFCGIDVSPSKYKKCANDSKCIGDSITIEYSSRNPEYSRIHTE